MAESSREGITKEEINKLPTGHFKGEIEVITNGKHITRALDDLKQCDVIGFDTETRPVFVKGKTNLVSLLQFSSDQKAYLFRIHKTGIPDALKAFLESPKPLKAGVAIRDDIKALQKITDFKANGFVELAAISRSLGLQAEGIRKLAALLLNFRVSKSAQISNWEAPQLTRKQIVYAATDAWVSLRIYQELYKLSGFKLALPDLTSDAH